MAREDIVLGFKTEGAGKTIQETERLTRSLKDLKRQTVETRGALVTLGRIVVPALMFRAAQSVVELTDAFTNLQNKVKLVTNGQGQLNYIMEQLHKTANESRTSIESVATVYSRTARAVAVLGKSQQETLQFTKTLSKAVAIGGSTAVEASNAMIQLSQGLSSGTLRGDELRSVLEQLPVVADLIAKKMGITVGELRKLGAAGKLTSKEVFEAIVAGAADIDAQFAKMRPTFSQAFQVLKNEALIASEAMQDSVGKLADMLLYLAKNFDILIDVAQSAAQILGVAFGVMALGRVTAGIKAISAAMAVNPILAMATAAALAAAAMGPFLDRIQMATDKTTSLSDVLSVVWDDHMKRIKPIGDALMKYIIDPISEWAVSLENVLIVLAKIVDVMRNMIDLPLALKQVMVMFNRLRGSETGITMGAEGSRTELSVRDILARADQKAADRENAELFAGRKKLSENTLAAMQASLPGPGGKIPKPDMKTSGKSAEDLIRELQEGLVVLRVRNQDEVAVQKRLEALIDQLGKNQGISAGQVLTMEDLIRQQEAIRIGKQLQEEEEKLINAALDERLKIELELMEVEAKISEELGKRVSQGNTQATSAIREGDAAIMHDLDPLADYKDRVQALEDFRSRHKEMSREVDNEIVKMSAAYQAFTPIMQGVATSIADAAANALIFGDNMGESLDRIAKAMAAQVLSTGFQLAMGAAVGAIGGPKLPGFASGGYTGGQENDVAGIVHGREFVMNAGATSRHRGMLEAMNNGQSPGGSSPNINVHNYGGAEVEVNQVSRGEIEIMIRKGVKEHAPKVVAGDMRGSNSATSKALRTSYETRQRR